ncbi:hypothetical protein, conserved [Eimeria tenella]|uniref:Uncharacterized protein n=1 Tax=Eimeria tenella TaxID=5802 RepID=U6KFZ4_EIMTE|nr:hypothetical protein, conserved [Eimeria tenella]CDJ36955.1 hypothetical protein, conserved [Eimeria tenella]|eukprot:XP_013227793.1 hypothetical protein, conserved [Eimeria tenella]
MWPLRGGEASAPAAATIGEYKQYELPTTTYAQDKAPITDEAHRKKRRHEERNLLVKEPNAIGLGNVLKGQAPLMRREMFRRRIFPIRFEESAKNVEEVQQLLMQRQPLGQFVISVFYLALLLIFIAFSLEITRTFEAADGVASPIKSALAPSLSNFNWVSYEAAKAAQITPTPASVSVTPDSGRPKNVFTISSKSDVASWLLYGFIPLLYGATSGTSNLGTARVVGNCFRLTFRQVQLEEVEGYDLGYEGVWPLSWAGASASIAAAKLRSENPLTNPSSSRFTYSYQFAPSGDDKAYNQGGGYYQVICEGGSCSKKHWHFSKETK